MDNVELIRCSNVLFWATRSSQGVKQGNQGVVRGAIGVDVGSVRLSIRGTGAARSQIDVMNMCLKKKNA